MFGIILFVKHTGLHYSASYLGTMQFTWWGGYSPLYHLYGVKK